MPRLMPIDAQPQQRLADGLAAHPRGDNALGHADLGGKGEGPQAGGVAELARAACKRAQVLGLPGPQTKRVRWAREDFFCRQASPTALKESGKGSTRSACRWRPNIRCHQIELKVVLGEQDENLESV